LWSVIWRPQKSRPAAGFSFRRQAPLKLLDFRFLEGHMLACLRIVFLHFQLVRRIPLVLVRGIEEAGIGGGHHSNFLAHQTFSPRPRSSDSTVSMPLRSMIRMPLVDTRRRT